MDLTEHITTVIESMRVIAPALGLDGSLAPPQAAAWPPPIMCRAPMCQGVWPNPEWYNGRGRKILTMTNSQHSP